MREHAIQFGRDRSLVGILTENQIANFSGKHDLTGILLLSTGLDHHVGPNRIYVKLARQLTAAGFSVFRFSFSGIGDSGPRRDKLPASESMIDETQQAMDYLERLKGIEQFIVIGLCNGAAAAFRVAAVDRRVRGAVLINPPAPATPQTELTRQHSYYWQGALFSLRSWKRLLFWQSAYQSIFQSVALKVKRLLLPSYFQNSEHARIINELTKCLQYFREQKIQLLILGSDDIWGDQYLREFTRKEYNSLKDAGLLSAKTLKGTDHLFTPLESQKRLLRLISEWMGEKFKSNLVICQ
jgi:pimeloyl-ACP methyl ester carboxylesterase